MNGQVTLDRKRMVTLTELQLHLSEFSQQGASLKCAPHLELPAQWLDKQCVAKLIDLIDRSMVN